MIKSQTSAITTLTLTDVVLLFYPYVEMTDRFKRVLISHSYLNYFMVNYESLFAKDTAACESSKAEEPHNSKNKFVKFFSRKGRKNAKKQYWKHLINGNKQKREKFFILDLKFFIISFIRADMSSWFLFRILLIFKAWRRLPTELFERFFWRPLITTFCIFRRFLAR